ncbi:MAG: hypothetical protein NT174_05045 [Actinobacteria bacterium]|nr:hypothetical protein [Actinomycetota bacterium]
MKKFFTVVASLALVSGAIVAIAPANAAVLRVPKTTWPACSDVRITYCVDSVTVTPVGGAAIKLTYVVSGTAAPVTPTPAAPVTTDTRTVTTDTRTVTTDTSTVKTPVAPAPAAAPGLAVAGKALTGRWTAATWGAAGLGALGYDGIAVEAHTANEFSNFVMVDVLPSLTGTTDNLVKLAGTTANPLFATSMDPDMVISIKLKTGDFQNGVTVAIGNAVTTEAVIDAASGNSVTITGSPVTVPVASDSKQCTGETGKAIANIRQFQVIIVPQNDDQSGFGVPGTSGGMMVASNGSCALSTPVWNNDTKQMTWSAAAPHFAADGTTVNKGFYRAIIPAKDADLLWGLKNAADAATALEVSVTTEAGGSTAATTNISVKNNSIIIDATGFSYSKPKLSVKIKPTYKPSAAAPAASTPAASTPAVKAPAKAVIKKITCVKGSAKKTVSGTAPKCPAGYKQK